MKTWKISTFLIAIFLISGLNTMKVLAQSDPTGDLWYDEEGQGDWEEYTSTNHPDIDITDVSYTKNGLQVTLLMTILGHIRDDMEFMYLIYVGDPKSESYYAVTYFNGNGIWNAPGITGVEGGNVTNPISSDGKTLSATITLIEDTTISVYANTIEFKDFLSGEPSLWQDWYPNSYFSGGFFEEDQDLKEDDENGDTVDEADYKTDSIDDVSYYKYDFDSSSYVLSSEDIADYPEIDITSIRASISGSILTLKMTVHGPISNSMYGDYYICYGTSDYSEYYNVVYSSYIDSAMYMDYGITYDFSGTINDCLESDEKTITVSFEIPKNDDSYVVWGYTKKWLNFEDTLNETSSFYYDDLRTDQINDEEDNENNDANEGSTNDNNNVSKGTPGFELIMIVAAIGFIIFIRRKKK